MLLRQLTLRIVSDDKGKEPVIIFTQIFSYPFEVRDDQRVDVKLDWIEA